MSDVIDLTNGDYEDDIDTRLRELEEYCRGSSNDGSPVTVEGLRARLDGIPQTRIEDQIQNHGSRRYGRGGSNFVVELLRRRAKGNHVTLDAIQLALQRHPHALHDLLRRPEISERENLVRDFIELDPESLRRTNSSHQIPLHVALDYFTEGTTASIVQMLVDGWQESTRKRFLLCDRRSLPIHIVCSNRSGDEREHLKILDILIKAYPESLLEDDRDDNLPIHMASRYKSAAVCKLLLDSCPETVTMAGGLGFLPIHNACQFRLLENVKLLLEVAPDTINAESAIGGYCPIHCAVDGIGNGSTFQVLEYLLQMDPTCASKPFIHDGQSYLPLELACRNGERTSTVRLLFDAYPEAAAFPRTFSSPFLSKQKRDLSTLSESSFPIHEALYRKATLGVIKLLLGKFPDQVQVVDEEGRLPLHWACEFGNIRATKCLLAADGDGLLARDATGNRPLHCACQFGHYSLVNYLLGINTVSVSERNSEGKLPFQLLIDANREKDSLVFTEAVWRLLVSSPDVVAGNS